MTTHNSELTAHNSELTTRRLVITFVPTTGLETGGLPWDGCGHSSTEREFPSDKVYRRYDRGIVGVESLSLQGLAFFDMHTSVGRASRVLSWPPGPALTRGTVFVGVAVLSRLSR
jgi:hypothetical protein